MNLSKARRQAARLWARAARRALLMLCFWPTSLLAGPQIVAAGFEQPTERYAHGVLGDTTEHGALRLELSDGTARLSVLPDELVFEDTAPRLVDVDLDGAPEVIVVESHQERGARLAVYDAQGRVATTSFIGTRFRWLAPIGAADFDGDGAVELAYIDRPHLARTLRLWRYRAGALMLVADLPGFTNHRIGERDIAGGVRVCKGVPEMIVARADWSQIVSLRYRDGRFSSAEIGGDTSRAGFARALQCPE
ncbi:VCBS repeat-containing protein [uncultured Roseobacter sp.]|uniref:FG-GAP repeat domain-containing protein n=1 Tax=uncultured Roseobacter sp. TaxID=114847 RepID=UPI00260B136B|nr:VCBS repeat-containing protein [uncultured Roseobacter sp.]